MTPSAGASPGSRPVTYQPFRHAEPAEHPVQHLPYIHHAPLSASRAGAARRRWCATSTGSHHTHPSLGPCLVQFAPCALQGHSMALPPRVSRARDPGSSPGSLRPPEPTPGRCGTLAVHHLRELGCTCTMATDASVPGDSGSWCRRVPRVRLAYQPRRRVRTKKQLERWLKPRLGAGSVVLI